MIDRRVKRILGYDRILEMLAEKAQSSLGKKLAEELEPADTLELAERLTEETKEAETITLSQPSFPLQSFSDIGPELGRLRSGAGLNAKELMRISQVLKASRRAKKGIQKDELGRLRLLPAMAGNLFLEDEIVRRIDEAILGEDEISDFASPELRSIRRKIQSENAFIREKLNGMIRGREHSKYLQDAIITMRDGRYVVPVKQEYRGAVPGLVHGSRQSGATLFIEPVSVVEANNRLAFWKGRNAGDRADFAGAFGSGPALYSGIAEQSGYSGLSGSGFCQGGAGRSDGGFSGRHSCGGRFGYPGGAASPHR